MSKELPTPQEAQILLEPVDAHILAQIIKATVSIRCEATNASFGIQQETSGTGVHIGNGIIITVNHTFRRFSERPNISILNWQSKTSQEGEVIYSSDSLDFGMLRVENPDVFGQVEIRPEKLTPCQTILVAVSHAFSLQTFRGMYLGDITDFDSNNASGLAGSFLFYHSIDRNATNAMIWSGASGGGVFNISGQLVGMIYGRLTNGEPKALALTGESIRKTLQASQSQII